VGLEAIDTHCKHNCSYFKHDSSQVPIKSAVVSTCPRVAIACSSGIRSNGDEQRQGTVGERGRHPGNRFQQTSSAHFTDLSAGLAGAQVDRRSMLLICGIGPSCQWWASAGTPPPRRVLACFARDNLLEHHLSTGRPSSPTFASSRLGSPVRGWDGETGGRSLYIGGGWRTGRVLSTGQARSHHHRGWMR
jgi:hypothetical protein